MWLSENEKNQLLVNQLEDFVNDAAPRMLNDHEYLHFAPYAANTLAKIISKIFALHA